MYLYWNQRQQRHRKFRTLDWNCIERAHCGFNRSAEDVNTSIAPDPSSNFCRGPCFLCSCFVFCFELLILNTVRYQDISFLFSIDDKNKRKKNNYKNSDNLSKNTLQSNVCDILLLLINKLSIPNVLHEYWFGQIFSFVIFRENVFGKQVRLLLK